MQDELYFMFFADIGIDKAVLDQDFMGKSESGIGRI